MWNEYWIWLTFERRQFCVDYSPKSDLCQFNNLYKCCCDFDDELFKCGDKIFVDFQNHTFVKLDCEPQFDFDLDLDLNFDFEFDFEFEFCIEFTSPYTCTKFRDGSKSERSC